MDGNAMIRRATLPRAIIRRPVIQRPSLGRILLTAAWLAFLAAITAIVSILRGDQ